MPEQQRPVAVLAFSGGLDTSFCVAHLREEHGYDVHTVCVDTGGFSADDLRAIEQRARELGAVHHETIDETEVLYADCLRYLVFGNVLRGNAYPLSVSAERTTQAVAVARYALRIGAACIVHGSTGAGNDQVRFDVAFRIVAPDIPVLTPIRDLRLSRDQEIAFLRAHGVDIEYAKARYSINQGLWGTTIGGVETLTSDGWPPDDAFPVPVTREGEEELLLTFTRGELTGVNGARSASSVAAIRDVERIARPWGVGRDMHVGDTIVGIKGRVAFDAAAPHVIIKAHHALEKHTLTKEQQRMKEMAAAQYGTLLHEGLFLEPAARDIESLLAHSQERVTGDVRLRLAPWRFHVLGVRSPFDLMSSAFGAYGEMNTAWTGDDVRGFARIAAHQIMMHTVVGRGGEDA